MAEVKQLTEGELLQLAVGIVTRFTSHSPVAVKAVFAARPTSVGEVLKAAGLNAAGEPGQGAGPKVDMAFEDARREIEKLKASVAESAEKTASAAVEQAEPGTGE